jgi:hypothetical protein
MSMKLFKLSILSLALVALLAGCALKVNITPKQTGNINEAEINTNQVSDQNENLNQPIQTGVRNSDYNLVLEQDNQVSQIKNNNGDVITSDLKSACGIEVMLYALPADSSLIIFKAYNPGSDKPIAKLYSFDLSTKACKTMNISSELGDFGAMILSANQSQIALAIESNEANTLKVLDLISDTTKDLVTLPEGQTLNGGYGGLSNHFDIKWVDNKTIQYGVYEDTVKNYDVNAPEQLEKVKQVRIINVE